jgi:dipeptidase E
MTGTPERIVVAMGGGGFSMEPENPLLDDHILQLARANRLRDRPRVCFLATASGDSPSYIASFYAAFARRSEASHLPLFDRTVDDIEEFLLDQDVIYVGGGNTENMLAIWRVHGVDHALRAAWESGVVMTGLSAGSLCWFETGTTDSFGPGLAALSGGLGFLPGSHVPHYDGEENRRPVYHRLIAEGTIPAGHAADDGAALVFHGTELAEVVASRPDARGYRVERGPSGDAVETELPTRYLG